MKRSLQSSWTLAAAVVVIATTGSLAAYTDVSMGMRGQCRRCTARYEGAVASQSGATSVWNGVFTEEQASRGQEAYLESCALCHYDDLVGDDLSPALIGAAFDLRWNDLSVGDMFVVIQSTMPQGVPGVLSPQEYVDIVSYLLQANDFPAGENELPPEELALNEIIVRVEHP